MKTTKISIAAIALAIAYSVGLIWQAAIQPSGQPDVSVGPELGYEEKIFNPDYVHTIDIRVFAADREKLKKDALDGCAHTALQLRL